MTAPVPLEAAEIMAPAPTETAEVTAPTPSETPEVTAPTPSDRALVASETTDEMKPGSTEVVEVTLVTITVTDEVVAGAAPDAVGLPPPRMGKAGVITGTPGWSVGTLKLKLKPRLKLPVGITMGEVAPPRSDVASPTMFETAELRSVATDARSEVASLRTDESNDVGRIELVAERTEPRSDVMAPRSDVTEPTAEVNAPVADGLRIEVASLSSDETNDVGKIEVVAERAEPRSDVTDPRPDVNDPRSDVSEPKAEVNAPVPDGVGIELVSVSIAPIPEVAELTNEVRGSDASSVVLLVDADVLLTDDGLVPVGSAITSKLDVVGIATETEMTTNGVDELLLKLELELETEIDDVVGKGSIITSLDELVVTAELVVELEDFVELEDELLLELGAVIDSVTGRGATTIGNDALDVATELEEELVLELDIDEVV